MISMRLGDRNLPAPAGNMANMMFILDAYAPRYFIDFIRWYNFGSQ